MHFRDTVVKQFVEMTLQNSLSVQMSGQLLKYSSHSMIKNNLDTKKYLKPHLYPGNKNLLISFLGIKIYICHHSNAKTQTLNRHRVWFVFVV